MNILLSAGEASGDAYAAALVNELSGLAGDHLAIEFAGIGGKRLKDTRAVLLADTSQWGAISIYESLKVFPKVIRSYYQIKRFIRTAKPGLFVPIDFGYVNIRLARHAKNHGWKVLYFAPPGSWRRDRQGRDLAKVTDAISTPFSWSADMLNELGANAKWFGHPIKQLLRDRKVGIAPGSPERIAVLPGSRTHEIDQNLPVLAASVSEPIEFGLAPSVNVEVFRAKWNKLAPGRTNDLFTQGDVYAVLTRTKAAIVCSGTATLEAALCRCPMVVIYKFPKIAALEARLVGFKRPKFIALPNILLGRAVVPELVQDEATSEAIRAELDGLLNSHEKRATQLAAFDELDKLLGPSDAITETAKLAFELLGGPS